MPVSNTTRQKVENMWNKIKAFFTKKSTKTVLISLWVLATTGLAIGGISADSLQATLGLTFTALASIAGLVAFIRSLL